MKYAIEKQQISSPFSEKFIFFRKFIYLFKFSVLNFYLFFIFFLFQKKFNVNSPLFYVTDIFIIILFEIFIFLIFFVINYI